MTGDRRGLLVCGVVLAALTEAIAGTVLSLGRGHVGGSTHATPDEIAWADVGYTACKIIGYMTAPWVMTRIPARALVIAATLAMGLACAAAAVTGRLDLLIALRLVQGLAGGLLLVAGQAAIFLACPRTGQPVLQALFAMGAVVAPAALVPVLHGWLIDNGSWTWILLGVVPVAMAAAGLLLLDDGPIPGAGAPRPFDWAGFALMSAAVFCLTYLFAQGSRWDWFAAPHLRLTALAGAAALAGFVVRQRLADGRGLIDGAVFLSADFFFAFIVSFVAGAALFGSAYLIPAFAVAVLGFTPTAAGLLLLPSGAVFAATLLAAALLMQRRGMPPIATVPLGILLLMAAMWLLSGSAGDSGADDMTVPVLLRGVGLGCLFLSITLIAFGRLDGGGLASGIGLFNTGRQFGGLMGVAGLQTLIDHEGAANLAVLGAGLTPGNPLVADRLATLAAVLAGRGMDAAAAARAATALTARAVGGQATLIAFDTAFGAVALFFVAAAPAVIAVKVILARRARRAGPPT